MNLRLFQSEDGSTARLLQYSLAYFFFYVLTGVAVKYFQAPVELGYPGYTDLQFLVYSTIGSAVVCLGAVFGLGWLRGVEIGELPYIVLSGVCTALVIPTTTLMYTLPISVMVAMVIMRGSVIVISRIVDTLLIFQGVSRKKVFWEENAAVGISLCAVGLHLAFKNGTDWSFLGSRAAVLILAVYILAYGVRIYLMNYFKFTRGGGRTMNNQNYFAVEQITASLLIFGSVAFAVKMPHLAPTYAETLTQTPPNWGWAAMAGIPFGAAAFFSVFLFLFKGRTSTFAGLVNRLASLLAGTAATLITAAIFIGRFPQWLDWFSFGLILVAVYFLRKAEKKRTALLNN